jgi:1-acyl-sn-glycerol-3-phosphate acyltransferase
MIPPALRRYHSLLGIVVRPLIRLLMPRLRVTGRNNIPHGGPVIFAANHISDADPPILGSTLRFPVAWMAKRELWDIGWLAPLLDFFGCIAIDPESPDRAALKLGFQTLEAGDALIIFPEGRLAHDGVIGPILPGALMLALKAGVCVVPVGMWGAQHVIPYGAQLPRPTLKPVNIHFGAPLRFDDLADLPSRRAREVGAKRLEEAIHAAVKVAKGS